MFNKELFADKLKSLTPYVVDRGEYKARLDANESYINLDKSIVEKLKSAIDTFDFNRYPDPDATELKKAFCDYYGLKCENVGVGNGSDEIISLLMNGFLDANSAVMTFIPDFSMYAFYANLAGMRVVNCKKDENFKVDFDLAEKTIKENDVKLVIFSNPCNPTGCIEKKSDIKLLATRCQNTIFVVDEAYMDFAPVKKEESFLWETEKYENIIVLKTLSKALGAASLRLGFVVADETFARMFSAVKSPYNVNGISQLCGKILLSEKDYLDKCNEQLVLATQQLHKKICENRIAQPHTTYTNFVFFTDRRATEKQIYLKTNGVLVRKFDVSGGALRITCGNTEENQLTLDLLNKLK